MSRMIQQHYWDAIADEYQQVTRISCDDFHYGPLVPGDRDLQLLPRDLKGRRCLELACGAAQNSVFLASQGATCVATDISENQLKIAQSIAEEHGVNLELKQLAMEALLLEDLGRFDLIHSSFGLPFAEDPAQLLQDVSKLLNPGGVFLASLAHPLSSGEWLELDGDGEGLYIRNYFSPEPEVREDDDGAEVFSRSYPVDQSINWLLDAGLTLTGIAEPAALPPDAMERAPYNSDGWLELAEQMRHMPCLLILKGQRPDA